MDLRDQERIIHPDSCFVCKYAGRYAVVWPQHTVDRALRQWYVFLKVEQHEPNRKTMPRSAYMTITACEEHDLAIYQNWVQVALDERWSDYLWNKEQERMGM